MRVAAVNERLCKEAHVHIQIIKPTKSQKNKQTSKWQNIFKIILAYLEPVMEEHVLQMNPPLSGGRDGPCFRR